MTQATTQCFREYYHASQRHYSVGEAIGPLPNDQHGYFVSSHPEGSPQAQAEQKLKICRPANRIGRERCIFLFNSLEQCILYFDAEYNHNPQNYFIYTVTAPENTGHPMVLVDRMAKLLNTSSQIDSTFVDRIANEYWTPTRKWKFPEFLCNSCTVLGCVEGHGVDRNESSMRINLMKCTLDYNSDYNADF